MEWVCAPMNPHYGYLYPLWYTKEDSEASYLVIKAQNERCLGSWSHDEHECYDSEYACIPEWVLKVIRDDATRFSEEEELVEGYGLNRKGRPMGSPNKETGYE